MSDEMPIYDRDNLPKEFEAPGGAAWTEMVLKKPLRVVRIDSAFEVRLPLPHSLRDSRGAVEMSEGGWLAIGADGDPFAISDDEIAKNFTAGGDSEPAIGDLLTLLADFVQKAEEGSIGLGFANGRWSASTLFGREAEDSPMAGGQALGECETLRDCLLQMATECGLVPR